VFFLLFKRNSKEKTLRVIFFYIVYCIINEALGYYFHQIRQNTFILFDIFTVVEFSLFVLFYYYALSEGFMKKAIFPIWLCFLIFASIHLFLVNNLNTFDSITSGVETILIILMCIYYLVVQIKGSNNLVVYSTTNFWTIITFLIYLCGTFFLYIMAENMIDNKNFQRHYLIINSAFNVLKNILLSVAMLMKTNQVPDQIPKNSNRDELFSFKLKN
jgi:hypothetical protein